MNELTKIDHRVQPYLFNVGYERWSRVFCRMKRTIFITSNIAESMNSTNKFARELPVRRLLEFLTKLMTQWTYENRKRATKSTELGKMYNKKFKKNMIASQNMTAIPSTDQLYTVVEGKRINIVDLGEGTCSCKRFQMNKLPCHMLGQL
ncbi:uncharacterized protein LOC132060867 [Lycium ferocissimum]|uniref:uncharacterized protein LOC132060867 n=1 Tax=Lycium ferocissimum TaxID=112874 RepID=UPI002816253B|nr:uncharacterized protein LOC132060867 [Lycium ferocissimum]